MRISNKDANYLPVVVVIVVASDLVVLVDVEECILPDKIAHEYHSKCLTKLKEIYDVMIFYELPDLFGFARSATSFSGTFSVSLFLRLPP